MTDDIRKRAEEYDNAWHMRDDAGCDSVDAIEFAITQDRARRDSLEEAEIRKAIQSIACIYPTAFNLHDEALNRLAQRIMTLVNRRDSLEEMLVGLAELGFVHITQNMAHKWSVLVTTSSVGPPIQTQYFSELIRAVKAASYAIYKLERKGGGQ